MNAQFTLGNGGRSIHPPNFNKAREKTKTINITGDQKGHDWKDSRRIRLVSSKCKESVRARMGATENHFTVRYHSGKTTHNEPRMQQDT